MTETMAEGVFPLLVAVALVTCLGALALGLVARRRPKTRDTRLSRPHDVAQIIAESTPDAVLLFSDAGDIRFANGAARELFFEGRDPTSENFLRILAHAPAPLREALLGEETRLVAIEHEGRRETYHVMRKTFEVGGELHTLLVVKHLTREIARQEVEVLKRVVRVVSHEVNNSLAPVTSLVHSARIIAKSAEPAAKLERIFSTIEERAEHLRTFLEGYAKVARLPQPRPREVEWRSFLRQLENLYPDVKLPSPPAASGWFDQVQVEQVLINVLKNAVESGSAAGDVEVDVLCDDSGACELFVHDRGHGFSHEALTNAFLPLFTTKEQGSGMGLSLAREIVEAHGGSLTLSNRPGGGATVTLRLPGREPQSSALGRSRLTLTRG